ncbi:ABC transporter substrate-binding protein [Niveispirillum lacus]|nr:ABC transporter substrate-binding protein [Niveispirillum lacus]
MLKPILSVLFAVTLWVCGSMAAVASTGELRMGMLSLALSADPHAYINTGARELSAHLYQPLYEKHPENNKSFHVVKSGHYSGNNTWELHLFPGEIHANDIVFTFCRIKNYPDTPSPFAPNLESITDVRVGGETELTIVTKSEDSQLLARISAILVMKAPPHWTGSYTGGRCDGAFAYDRADLDSGRVTPGTGPYRIERFSADEIVMVRRGGKLARLTPWQRVVQLRLSTEESVRQLLAGTVDIIDSVPDGPAAHLAAVSDTKTAYGYPASFVFLQLNHRATSSFVANGAPNPLRDKRVRQALSLALDREIIATRQRFDPSIPTAQISLPENPLYNDGIDLRADVDRARRLLAEAGYASGFTVDFLIMPGTAWIADKVEPMLGRIGVQVKTRDVGPRFPGLVANGEFGLNLNVSVVDQTDIMAFVRSRLASPGIAAGFGSRNQGQYTNSQLNELLLKIRSEPDTVQRSQMEQQAMSIVTDDLPIIPLVFVRPRWHLRADLAFTPRRDNRMLVWNIVKAQ